MASVKHILMCCLLVIIFQNKSGFIYGVECEICRKYFKVSSNISGNVKIDCNKTTIPESNNVRNNKIETPNLSAANFNNTAELQMIHLRIETK